MKFWKSDIAIPDGLGRKESAWCVMKVAWSSFSYLHLLVHRMVGMSKFNLCKELRAHKLAGVQPLAWAKSVSDNIPMSDAVEQLMKKVT